MSEERWPKVMGELETMRRIVAGSSVARYGDGEIGCVEGKGYYAQVSTPRFTEEIKRILTHPAPGMIPCIPTMDKASPRYETWPHYRERYLRVLDLDREYGSAFIGCRAKAPWIDTKEYSDLIRSLGQNKRTIAVAPWDLGSQYLKLIPGIKGVVVCKKEQAYDDIDELERLCLEFKPERVLVSGGPMATCLANRMAGHGIQGVDFGRAIGLAGINQ